MSSTLFLAVYLTLCLGLHAANVWAWRRAERASASSAAPAQLDRYALALLNGGPRRVVATAVVTLRSRGQLIDGTMPGIVEVAGEAGAATHPLERAVRETVERWGQFPTEGLERDRAVREAIEVLRRELTASGQLIDARTIWLRGLWVGGPVLLVALGTVRLASTWDYDGDEVMRVLLVAVLATAVVMVSHINDERRLDKRPLPSARGQQVLADWIERDPGEIAAQDERIALLAALTPPEHAPSLSPTDAGCSPPQGAVRDQLSLADEILLLGVGQDGDQCPPVYAGAMLAGALLVELAALGRLDIAIPLGESEPFVRVVDREPTGDELLDDALALLIDPGAQATGPSVTRLLLSAMSRRRLHARGRVSKRDLVAWWWNAWTCAEFPQLTPTVLRYVLVLHERLHPLEDRVAARLVSCGALRQRFARGWPYTLAAHDVRQDLRDRVLSAALATDPLLDTRATYRVAMCASYGDWLLDAICTGREEREQIKASARFALGRDLVARTVDVIVFKSYTAFDDD